MNKHIVLFSLLFFTLNIFAAEVNVYSARKEALIKPLLKEFTKETGIKVNLITGEADALIKRMEVEGTYSPADVLITVDAARLHRAKEKGLLQTIESDYVNTRVPEVYTDPENKWVGLSLRSRVIVYANERVDSKQLSTYEDLISEKWHKKLCVRSSSNVYNQSLLASIIHHSGKQAAQEWAKGLVNNFARNPKGGDKDQISAVAAGQCEIALVNTYYVGGMIHSQSEKEQDIVSKVSVFWPNQEDRGAHVNLSGVGITSSSKNTQEAVKLIEYLLNDESQAWYAKVNIEYPVVGGIDQTELDKFWGPFKADSMQIERLGHYNKDAVIIMDSVGWK